MKSSRFRSCAVTRPGTACWPPAHTRPGARTPRAVHRRLAGEEAATVLRAPCPSQPALVLPRGGQRAVLHPALLRDHDRRPAVSALSRRDFVTATVAGGLALAGARRSRLADSRIDVLVSEPIGTIAPELYGHFVEHLGGVVYDGVWVGEKSRIPNIGGLRQALVDAFRLIHPGVVRWPGGCFADSYDWHDGVGPRERRPRRTNFWSDDPHLRALGDVPAKYDPNQFGTNEFMRFCRLVAAQPYFAVNLRTLPPRSFDEWLEYCNAPSGSTTLAEQP